MQNVKLNTFGREGLPFWWEILFLFSRMAYPATKCDTFKIGQICDFFLGGLHFILLMI